MCAEKNTYNRMCNT